MKKIFLILILVSACKGGGGAASADPRHCAKKPYTEYQMIPETDHDNYELVREGCEIEIRNLDTGCTRYGIIETNPYPNFGADLTVYNKINCSDSYPDEVRCTTYKNSEGEVWFGCMLLGIDAYFTEVL